MINKLDFTIAESFNAKDERIDKDEWAVIVKDKINEIIDELNKKND